MPSQSPHLDMTPVVWTVRSLANRPNQQKRGHLGNSQLPPAKRRVTVPAGERDSIQGGSSVASTIQGQNSIPSSSLNNSRIADINQHVTSTPCATQRRAINTTTTTPVTSSRSTPAPGGTSTRCVVSRPAFGIGITPTPLSGLENLPTPIPNPEARAIITNPLRTWATERIRDKGSGNCNRRRCLHLDQWSPAVAASIDLVTPTWCVWCLQQADSWSSTCRTESRLWVQATWRAYVMQSDAFWKH